MNRLQQTWTEFKIGWATGRRYGKLAKKRCKQIRKEAHSNAQFDTQCAVYKFRREL